MSQPRAIGVPKAARTLPMQPHRARSRPATHYAIDPALFAKAVGDIVPLLVEVTRLPACVQHWGPSEAWNPARAAMSTLPAVRVDPRRPAPPPPRRRPAGVSASAHGHDPGSASEHPVAINPALTRIAATARLLHRPGSRFPVDQLPPQCCMVNTPAAQFRGTAPAPCSGSHPARLCRPKRPDSR